MRATAACRICLAIALTGGVSPAALAQVSVVPISEAPRLLPCTTVPEPLPASSTQGHEAANSVPYHLSLDEAKTRTLQNSVVMDLASLQVLAKCNTLAAARKDYLPKFLNSFSYFHFDSDLGTVLTTPGILNPAQSIAVPVIEQDATIYTAAAIQPITPLLKVREAVKISAADVATAEAQKDFARGELIKGVEQLYFGLLASQRSRAVLEQAVAGAKQLAEATKAPDAEITLVQARQGVLAAEYQVVTLTDQLNSLVDLPECTELALDDPPSAPIPFECIENAVAAAVSCDPSIREARQQVVQAEAALRIAKSNYVPNVMAYGFYVNQDATPTIQDDFSGVGVSASYLLEWGKKNDQYRASVATVALARKNLRKTTEDTRQSASKAYFEAIRAEQSLQYAKQLAELNRQVKPPATDLAALKAAANAGLEAELALIKAELDFRTAVVLLSSITGHSQ